MGSGLALAGIGLFLMRGLTATSGWTALLPGFLVAGFGVGVVNPVLASTSIGVVPPQRSGMASGINNTFRQVGIATGIAALGALFESTIRHKLEPFLAGTPVVGKAAQIAHAVAGGGTQTVLQRVPVSLHARASTGIHVAFAAAMNNVLLVGGLVALAGAVLSFALVRGRDFATYGAPEPAAAAAG
jgi:hypothetical protein